jgi:hypothetical protein
MLDVLGNPSVDFPKGLEPAPRNIDTLEHVRAMPDIF